MMPKHHEQAAQLRSRLDQLGFPAPVLERVGCFAVYWGLFESNLEPLLWKMRAEVVAGKRPSTDKSTVGEWIPILGKGSDKLDAEANAVLQVAANAAENLLAYRHALFHGALVPSEEMPLLIRNPRWHGEWRKRGSNTAYISANLLDMAIVTVWILGRVVGAAEIACDLGNCASIVQLRPEVVSANSMAFELRHLAAAAQSEKY